MPSLQYSSQNITLVFGGKLITGWADGDFVRVSYRSNYWEQTVGTDGVSTRHNTRDKSGEIEITLMASSPSNDYLSACLLADQQSNTGVLPFLLRDAGGNTLVTAEEAWVVKAPDVTFSRAVSTRVWQLAASSMDCVVAGAVRI